MIRPVHCWKRTDVSIIPIVGAIALELIEAGWDFSILKPRRLESRPYTAGALTHSSSGGNVSGFPCPRGSPEQGKGGRRGHAPTICPYMCRLELLGTSLPLMPVEPAIFRQMTRQLQHNPANRKCRRQCFPSCARDDLLIDIRFALYSSFVRDLVPRRLGIHTTRSV